MEIRPWEQSCSIRTTDVTNLVVTFRNFAKAPEKNPVNFV